MIRPVFPFGPFRPFIAIYTLNGRRRRYHRLNKQPAGNDGDDELVNSHHDDDDDIYIMMSVCLSVTKNHHFLLGVFCDHLNYP